MYPKADNFTYPMENESYTVAFTGLGPNLKRDIPEPAAHELLMWLLRGGDLDRHKFNRLRTSLQLALRVVFPKNIQRAKAWSRLVSFLTNIRRAGFQTSLSVLGYTCATIETSASLAGKSWRHFSRRQRSLFPAILVGIFAGRSKMVGSHPLRTIATCSITRRREERSCGLNFRKGLSLNLDCPRRRAGRWTDHLMPPRRLRLIQRTMPELRINHVRACTVSP